MDFEQLGIGAMIVTVIVDAIKEGLPKIGGNLTRLIAMLTGGVVGAIFQYQLLPGVEIDLNIVSGLVAGATAIAFNTIATRVAGGEPVENERR